MSRHSEMCHEIGGGPGHEACVCMCHGTMAAKAIMLDDPDWHAAACAYDAGTAECDCLLPKRLDAIEADLLAQIEKAVLAIPDDRERVGGEFGYIGKSAVLAAIRSAAVEPTEP